jgi:steroid 5-alpha reductase family enzyme
MIMGIIMWVSIVMCILLVIWYLRYAIVYIVVRKHREHSKKWQYNPLSEEWEKIADEKNKKNS